MAEMNESREDVPKYEGQEWHHRDGLKKRDWGTKPATVCEEAQKIYIVYHDSNNIHEHSIISVGVN